MVAYDLVLAKGGIRMREHLDQPTPNEDRARTQEAPLKLDKDGFPDLGGRPGSMAIMNGRARANQVDSDMKRITELLSSQTGKPVVDATGLAGKYDFTLTWVAETRMRATAPDVELPEETGPTLEQAVQDQLGLKLRPRREMIDVLVVDTIAKAPTDN